MSALDVRNICRLVDLMAETEVKEGMFSCMRVVILETWQVSDLKSYSRRKMEEMVEARRCMEPMPGIFL